MKKTKSSPLRVTKSGTKGPSPRSKLYPYVRTSNSKDNKINISSSQQALGQSYLTNQTEGSF